MRRSSEDLHRDSYTGRPPSRGPFRAMLQVVLLISLVLGAFVVGEYVQRLAAYREAREVGRAYDPTLGEVSPIEPLRSMVLNALAFIPRPWAEEQLMKSGLPVYDLRIDSNELAELQQIAERVTAQTVSTGIARPYVPAEFLMEGQWEAIQVKLRGLYSQHYIKTRPSLRLKFPNRKLLHGVKQVNLLDPYDKGLTIDVTTGWELERHGLMTWDSRFVVLRLNGDVLGVFQEIEQFGRSMPDRTGRPEGPIFSGYGQAFGKPEGGIYEKAVVPLRRIQACLGADDLRAEGVEREAGASASDCDWAFFSEYFDAGKWAWAAAAAQLLHSSHAWHPDNVRMFWDPARGSFEPIPWDYGIVPIDLAARPDAETNLTGYAGLFLPIAEFRRMRDVRVWELLETGVDPMIEHAEALFESLTPALRLDLRHPDFGLDEARQAEFVAMLRHNRAQLHALYDARELRARVHPAEKGKRTIVFTNPAKSFARIDALRVEGPAGLRRVPLASSLMVDGAWRDQVGEAVLSLALGEGDVVIGVEGKSAVTGKSFADAEVKLELAADPAPPSPSTPGPPSLRFDADNLSQRGWVLRFGPGKSRVRERIDLPPGFDVEIAPGTQIDFAAGTALMIRGDLSARGTADAPIRISGASSNDEPDGNWQGVFVQGTRLDKSRVTLHHTTVEGGVGGENARSFFTSSFAVHDGIVELVSSNFDKSAADDGLNLKYASVKLVGNTVTGSRDDSLDCDFCTGELLRNEVRDSGGDGFDFSGSDVTIRSSRVKGCADKGMSIGENTRARVVGGEVSGCYTGIAAKDLSRVEIEGLSLRDLQVGIAAYIKKPTFGPSHVTVRDVSMRDVETRVLRDASCTIEGADETLLGARP